MQGRMIKPKNQEYEMERLQESAVKKRFNHIADNYALKRDAPEIIRERERILNLIAGVTRYQRILDIGCGPGIFFDRLLDIGDEIHGIDISERMIELASERFEKHPERDRIHLKVGDASLKLDFPDAFFDLVLAIGVLRYMSSWESTLSEIRRISKPAGTLSATFFSAFLHTGSGCASSHAPFFT